MVAHGAVQGIDPEDWLTPEVPLAANEAAEERGPVPKGLESFAGSPATDPSRLLAALQATSSDGFSRSHRPYRRWRRALGL